MDNCPVCNRKILIHSKTVKCLVCASKVHIRCITLNFEEQNDIAEKSDLWYCTSCISEIFPFNTIENDTLFLSEINKFSYSERLAEVSDILFQPFELNNNDSYSPLFDIDPDINFFNKIDYQIGSNCNYYMEDTFHSNLNNSYNSQGYPFSLCHLNIRRMPANLQHFERYLESLHFEFSCIGLTETWLRDENCNLYCLNGYTLVEKHRVLRKGGGVGLLVKDAIPFQTRDDLTSTDDDFESVFIEIDKTTLNKCRNVVIGVIYRPPNSDIVTFNDSLAVVLEKLKNENKICYLLGDYNIDLLNYERHIATSEFIELMHSYCFISLINRPTRITNTSATLIDNIFTNDINLINSFQAILVADISDHFPIVFVDCDVKLQDNEDYIIRRNMSERNKISFRNAIANLDWDEMYHETDTQSAFSLFHSTFLKLYNVHFPKQKLKMKYNTRKMWLSQELKDAIKIKNKLYKCFIKVPIAYNETKYKSYRNKLTHLLVKTEKQHFTDLLAANQNNMKKTWQIMKNIVNRKKSERIQCKFKIDDQSTTDNKHVICNKFNDFLSILAPILPERSLKLH